LSPEAGGPPVVCLNLAAAQARLGHLVAIVSSFDLNNDESVCKLITSIPGCDQIEFRVVPPPGLICSLTGFCQKAEKVLGDVDVDVMHIHGIWEPFLLTLARWSISKKIPYIISPHGMLYPYCLAEKALKKRVALDLLYRRFINSAAALHVLNDDEARAVTPFSSGLMLVVVPNGVDDQALEIAGGNDTDIADAAASHGKPYFVFLGRLHHIKGIDLLLEAFGRYVEQGGDFDLAIVGPDGGYLGSIQDWMIRNRKLTNRLRIPGAVYGLEKYDWIRNAAAYVQTSRHETFSMSITEAMALAKPVIITGDCHFPEVGEEGAGFVTSANADAVAARMLELERDGGLRERMGRAGSELVKKRFRWESSAAELIKGYEAMCGSIA
jgi:glycosyltransferase involved in cell wall biosynthesis